MTEQSLIEYAKHGDPSAIKALEVDFPGVLWPLAITHVNGGWLPGHEIKRVWDEMANIAKTTAMSMEEVRDKLQAALNAHHMVKSGAMLSTVNLSPAGRPWNFKKRGRGGPKYTPPKKKRKK